ncbi:hypothetical protein HFN_1473 [Helicobacter fennelliae MRY12-0050]|uniref:Uncharacterized protein n=1 Tax=Helicobacter fennelliae MRY12-0050 TaxID=1325130 RepID=T1CMF5_9HELI|nr:hypothetical protein HFN_1473 [Helicobacter fennelliae MRY12-0050]
MDSFYRLPRLPSGSLAMTNLPPQLRARFILAWQSIKIHF